MAKAALVVVDMQNDFLAGGALPVPGGDDVVETLNRYIERFQQAGLPIIATRDWHPRRTTHFQEFGGTWPVHCVQGTPGAEFHKDLRLPPSTIIISKGMGENEDAYSGFQGRDEAGRPMAEVLRALGVEHLYVGGIATDYCARATALGGLGEGFRVTILIDTMRGINLKPGDIEQAIADMVRAGASVTTLERLDLSAEVEGAQAASAV
jgi:nicotinamidase/pyrazinamidase